MITPTDTHSALTLFHLREAELRETARRHRLVKAASPPGRAPWWARLRLAMRRRRGSAGSRAPALP